MFFYIAGFGNIEVYFFTACLHYTSNLIFTLGKEIEFHCFMADIQDCIIPRFFYRVNLFIIF